MLQGIGVPPHLVLLDAETEELTQRRSAGRRSGRGDARIAGQRDRPYAECLERRLGTMHAGLGRLQLLAQQTPQLGQLGTFQVRRNRDEPVRNRIDHPRHARRTRARERDAQEVAAQVGRNAESVAQTAGSVAQRRDTEDDLGPGGQIGGRRCPAKP